MWTLLVDHLWQSTLCVLLAWLLTLALSKNAARVRYWVWLAASIKFLVPFSALTWIGTRFSWNTQALPAISEVAASFQRAIEPLATPMIGMRETVSTFDAAFWLIAVWSIGSIALLLRWMLAWSRVWRAASNAKPIQIAAPIVARESSTQSEPGVIGIFRPVLLLPEGIASRLSPAQMQAVIAHELCHVRRRDNLTATIHMLVEVLFWFHPLVWWLGACLVDERERACDEGVIELQNEPQAYAEGILKVCQYYMESKLVCVAGISGADLKRRVEAIMSHRRSIELHVGKRIVLSAFFAALIVVPVVSGVMTPSFANNAKDSVEGIENLRIEAFESRSSTPPQNYSGMELLHPGETIRYSIAPAYRVQLRQVVGGPAWIDTVRYDQYIGGTGLAPEGMARLNQYTLLERRMLAEQFELKFHREMQSLPVYVLSISDRGRAEKLQEVAPGDNGGMIKQSVEPGAPEAFPRLMTAAPMHHFAYMLSRTLDGIVLDRTGLVGTYRFQLTEAPTVDTMPALLENQLGLKLTRSTEQVEMIVIDSIQQPTARIATGSMPAGAKTVPIGIVQPTAGAVILQAPSASGAKPLPIHGPDTPATQNIAQGGPYSGARVNLQFTDIDLRAVTKVLEDISGHRIVVHPSINEKVTFTMRNAPWDQALAEMVASKGLVMRREGPEIHIDPRG